MQASWAEANAGILKLLWGGGVAAGTLATCWAVEGEESTAEIVSQYWAICVSLAL